MNIIHNSKKEAFSYIAPKYFFVSLTDMTFDCRVDAGSQKRKKCLDLNVYHASRVYQIYFTCHISLGIKLQIFDENNVTLLRKLFLYMYLYTIDAEICQNVTARSSTQVSVVFSQSVFVSYLLSAC